MSVEIPDFIRRAMEAQGKVDPDEVAAKAAALDLDAEPAGEQRVLPPPADVHEQFGISGIDEALSDPDADSVGRMHGDPRETEHAAAVRTMPGTGTQRRRVLDALGCSRDDGMTDEEIGAVDGIADTAHRTRRRELVEGGWVEDSGRVRRTAASGSDSVVWILTTEGRARWRQTP